MLVTRARRGFFVRYDDGVKDFRVYSCSEGGVILSRMSLLMSTMYLVKSLETLDLGREADNLLQIDRALEVH